MSCLSTSIPCDVGRVPGGECPNEATVRLVFRNERGMVVETRAVCNDPDCRLIAGYSGKGLRVDEEPLRGSARIG